MQNERITPREQEVLGKSPLLAAWATYTALREINEWLERRLREVNERWAALHAPFPEGESHDTGIRTT